MAGSYDGSSCISVSYSPYSGDTTLGLGFWFKPSTEGTHFILRKASNNYWLLTQVDGSGHFGVNGYQSGGSSVDVYNTSATVNSGAWNHAFIWWNASTDAITIWLNGTSYSSTLAQSGLLAQIDLVRSGSFIGTTGAYTGELWGSVLWSGISKPSDSDIAAIIAGTDPETQLGSGIARWDMDSSGGLLTDSIGSADFGSDTGTVTYVADAPSFATTVDVTGSTAASSAVSGSVDVTRTVTGSAAASSGTSAVASVSRTATGTTAGLSGASADGVRSREVAGTSASLSSTLASVDRSRSVAGSIAGSSASTGDAKAHRAITGGVGVSSTADASVERSRKIVGSSAAQSAASGSVTVTGASQLAGSTAATSAASGAVARNRTIAGTLAGTSAMSGSVTQAGSTKNINGALAGASAVSGTASRVREVAASAEVISLASARAERTRRVSGSIAGTSSATNPVVNTEPSADRKLAAKWLARTLVGTTLARSLESKALSRSMEWSDDSMSTGKFINFDTGDYDQFEINFALLFDSTEEISTLDSVTVDDHSSGYGFEIDDTTNPPTTDDGSSTDARQTKVKFWCQVSAAKQMDFYWYSIRDVSVEIAFTTTTGRKIQRTVIIQTSYRATLQVA